MNHAGEIRDLAAIARPDVGVVTNVGYAHIENFESIEGIAAAKRELIEALGEHGTAVLNADDARVAAFRRRPSRPHRSLWPVAGRRTCAPKMSSTCAWRNFGRALPRGRRCILQARSPDAMAFPIFWPASRWPASTGFRRTAYGNGSAAYARQDARRTLRHHGVLIYNDCYNSNPDAVRAMLDVLRDTPARRRIAVLGEMLELGRWAEPLHRDVGNYAAMCGIRCARWNSRRGLLHGGRGQACRPSGRRRVFFRRPREKRAACCATLAQPGDAILFKGSRGVHVELAWKSFCASTEGRRRLTPDVLLAFYEKLFHLLFAFPRVSILDLPHGHGDADRDAAVDCAGAVADRAAARIPDRSAHSRGWSAIAPQESRHADHGRLADLCVNRRCRLCCGPTCASPPCGWRWPDWSASAPSDSWTTT